MAKSLVELLSVITNYEVFGDSNILVEGIADDSRDVKEKYMFICLRGHHVDGNDYIDAAIDQGAVVILTDKAPSDTRNVCFVVVSDVKVVVEAIVPLFFDYPAQKLKVFGITGTNGKTSVTYLLRKIAEASGKKVGVIGTISVSIGDRVLPSRNTTPNIVELQSILNLMVTEGVEYLFMEVSSHALALNRIAGCEFDYAVLTNITQDHLDFHKTFEAYVDAKGLLFESLSKNKVKKSMAILNSDDKSFAYIKSKTDVSMLTYGENTNSDILPISYEIFPEGMKTLLKTPVGNIELNLHITGHFNLYNVMAAVCGMVADGVLPEYIKSGLENFFGVPGRFELVKAGQPFSVIVDYAHTPDGLENVLSSARKITQGRLISVFGCGGDRDKTKRPLMGKIAEDIADVVFITSDNPRSEDPNLIINDIKAGMSDFSKIHVLSDRKTAIVEALKIAQKGDVVLIAGKGHETYQILGDKVIDFDDRVVAKEFLKENFEK